MVNGNLLQPFRGQLHFYYRCPECNGEFYLDHKTLKVETDFYETKCCFCEKLLFLRVLLSATCSTEWKTSVTRRIEKAISVLRAQGYSKKESKRLVDTVEDITFLELSVEEIIRRAIENEEVIK